MNLLCLDIGNTRIKAGVFAEQTPNYGSAESPPNNTLCYSNAFAPDTATDMLAFVVEKYAVTAVMVSSVADERKLCAYLHNDLHLPIYKLNQQTPLPLNNRYATPHTLGKDRLAAVAGAHYLFPQRDVLVMDSGTCIKFDFIDRQGNYLGGSIAPGIAMQFQALQHFTQSLPCIPFDTAAPNPQLPPLIGNNTRDALLSGVLHHSIAACKGMIDNYRRQTPNLNLLLTGGDAPFWQHMLTPNAALFVPNLILYGLYHIFQYQQKP